MLRNARHSKILELIEEKEIETQEELCKELAAANFQVTQATVSRDVREMHLFKVAGLKKRYRYASVSKSEGDISEKMRTLFQTSVESIHNIGNIIVIKTLSGNGKNAGIVVDKLRYDEVLGSVAGEDTVFSVCKTAEGAAIVRERLERIAKS